ncbi:MAG: DUF485 domain-containing protein [Sulfurimonas sp.]
MEKDLIEKIKSNPDYQTLVKKRTSFAIVLTIIMLVVYFAFILTIAFDPSVLGTPLSSDSVTTVGIPVGIVVIVIAFILTGVYTKRANGQKEQTASLMILLTK